MNTAKTFSLALYLFVFIGFNSLCHIMGTSIALIFLSFIDRKETICE